MSVLSPAKAFTVPVAPQPRRKRWWRPGWRPAALFAVAAGFYCAVGYVLLIRYNLFDPDGPSRVANAAFTIMSRDPHLSAIGFVWNPLPSLVEIPVAAISRWWPELRTTGLAGVPQSAAFMAGAVLLVRQIALDRGVSQGWRWVTIGCFAVNPVIVTYGGSGMSEAAEVFCLLWCVRYLLLWMNSQRTGDVALAGVALGVGYLARYEMVPAACGAAVLVGAVAFTRAPKTHRVHSTILSILIVVFPIGIAFGAWAITGWIINGELIATLSSRYGNEEQVAFAVSRGETPYVGYAGWYLIAARLFANQPFVGFAVTLGLVSVMLRKKVDILIPIVTFGAVLLFAAWSQYSSETFGLFRYFLPAIPLVIVVVLVCWQPGASPPGWWRAPTMESRLGAILISASLVVGLPVTAISMLNPDIGNQPLQFGMNSLLNPEQYPPDKQWYRRQDIDERMMARFLDRKHLPDGSVLLDTFWSGLWLASDDPTQFVITSDYDFKLALNRPWDFGIQYIVVSNPNISDADAVNLRYPTMWHDGAGIGTLVYSAEGPLGGERRRIYHVDGPPTPHAGVSGLPARPGG